MIEPTNKEFGQLEFIRVESYRNYFYGLARLPNGHHATVSRYKNGPFSVNEIPTINEDIPMKQSLLAFVNDHAAIHISPAKHIWRWINND